MNYESLKHFRIEFTNFAPVSGKPLTANLLFDNKRIGTFQSLDRKISYHHQNYNLTSTAYDYDSALYKTLTELNDEVFHGIRSTNDPIKLHSLTDFLLTNNRFTLPVTIQDPTIGKKFTINPVNMQAIINDSIKVFNK